MIVHSRVPTCHSCDVALAMDATADDICDDCLFECLCWVCRQTRDLIAEDWAEQADLDASREDA